jgi:polar amino acid transport system substrate-binding protein
MDLRKDFRNVSVGRRMRWASGFALAGILALGLAACGTSGSGATTGANCPDTSNLHLVQAGTLTIASDTTYKPAEFVDPNDPSKFAGYDIELGNEIAKRMCLTPHVVTATFGPELLSAIASPALGQQRYDMSISSWTIRDDRLAVVDMIPYFQAGESLLVAKGNPKNIKKIADLCGKIVAVQTDTTEEGELKDANGEGDGKSGQEPVCKDNKIRIQSNSDQNLVVQTVVNGQADASYQDEPVTGYYVSQNSDKAEIGGVTVAPAPQGMVVRKDNKPFEDAVRTALKAMVADGTYLNILKKWGVESGAYTTGL